MKKIMFLTMILVSFAMISTSSATILGTVDIQNHNNGLSDTGYMGGTYCAAGNYYTGVYSWTNVGGTGLGTVVPNFGFCIELTQGSMNTWHDVIPLNESPLPPVGGIVPMGVAKADAIRELWGRFFDPSWATGANRPMAGAFSAALWEIVWETDATWDVTTGTGFYCSFSQAAAANAWLASLNGDRSFFANGLVAISDEQGQDFLVQIPEPATICMLGFGALSLLRKRSA